jgi:hypothetical protein
MPSWSEIRSNDLEALRVIEESMSAFSRTDLRVMRRAIVSYLEWVDTLPADAEFSALSKLYVLYRYVFDLPTRLPLGSIRFFGGWHGIFSGPQVVNAIWPWKIVGGKKRLRGTFAGYTGHPYLAMAEFDYFQQTFGAKGKQRKRAGLLQNHDLGSNG